MDLDFVWKLVLGYPKCLDLLCAWGALVTPSKLVHLNLWDHGIHDVLNWDLICITMRAGLCCKGVLSVGGTCLPGEVLACHGFVDGIRG